MNFHDLYLSGINKLQDQERERAAVRVEAPAQDLGPGLVVERDQDWERESARGLFRERMVVVFRERHRICGQERAGRRQSHSKKSW